ncbi:MAG: hypothetical protein FWE74_05635 [Oscillospiraceae bacterium]|nr:hypothetical protein [Oscillospiraceae bacterium]
MPLAIAIVIALIMIMTVISEYIRLNIIAKGVRDALQSAIVATVNDNYNDIYHSAREGYAAGFQPNAGSFTASIDHGDVWGRLETLLGLQQSGGHRVKLIGSGEQELRLSGLNITVNNTPLAPSDRTNAQPFTADATIQLEVPVSFAGNALPPLRITLRVRAGWINKF